jgi:hypothetical protein
MRGRRCRIASGSRSASSLRQCAQVCRYRSGVGHYRTGVLVDSELRTSTASDKSRNHHFGGCPSLGFSANLGLTTFRKVGRRPMGAPVDLSRGLCSDQEQPLVEPQLGHTEHDPAGTVRAPQSMQSSRLLDSVIRYACSTSAFFSGGMRSNRSWRGIG